MSEQREHGDLPGRESGVPPDERLAARPGTRSVEFGDRGLGEVATEGVEPDQLLSVLDRVLGGLRRPDDA